MYTTCRHIKTNGLPCESPMLKGSQFCYYHSKLHSMATDLRSGQLVLPTPEDPAAIQLSIARINQAILNEWIDLPKARSLLNGLRIAAQFMDRTQCPTPTRTVQSTEKNGQGDELAPHNYVCDDDEDCNECPYSELCPRCIRSGDE